MLTGYDHLLFIFGAIIFYNDGVNGDELWKSDGTFGGIVLVTGK